jgi:hypothetical protein
MMNRWHLSRWICTWIGLGCLVDPSGARAVEPPRLEGPTPLPSTPAERGTPRPRNGVGHHEALLSAATGRSQVRVDKSPPPPVVERPGDSPPSPDAHWVDGYWDWDGERKDFTWVAGIWRIPPQGTFWVNGYWRRDDQGWYRVPGFWCAPKGAPAASSPGPTVSTPTVVSQPSASDPNATTRRSAARPAFAPLDRVETNPAVPQVDAPVQPGVATAPADARPASLAALADQLAAQAAAFEQVFGMTASVTPQGGAFLADAQRLRSDASVLRRAVTAGDANVMALAFRNIDITWRRMAARVNMIAPGRTGPNIQQIGRMGETIAQMGRGMQ